MENNDLWNPPKHILPNGGEIWKHEFHALGIKYVIFSAEFVGVSFVTETKRIGHLGSGLARIGMVYSAIKTHQQKSRTQGVLPKISIGLPC